jgi:peptide/nickel transport system substrate-binding protein
MFNIHGVLRLAAFAAVAISALPSAAAAEKVIKAVLHSDVKILDPIWTTAYIQRNHGYMVWDTLFAVDEKLEPRPQMVDRYNVSDDKLTYSFTLREGLLWHDGQPVTAEDCIASIKRWGKKDSMGQKLMSFVAEMKAVDEKSFTMVLREPYGLVIASLGKPSSNVPFMMPKRIAETDANTQISEFIGSGPFVFKKDEWRPGEKTVYVKFGGYKPRPEPPSWLAGGKVVNVDRVEWLAISDHLTATNALMSGEIDYMEAPPIDLLSVLSADRNIGLITFNTLGTQNTFRFNWLQPPFDNPKVRRAALYALSAEDGLKATIGDPEYYSTCKPMFGCGTKYESLAGINGGLLDSNFEKSKALLKEAGYDGTPVVLLQATDVNALANLGPVSKTQLEKGGFKVDMQALDWQSVVARRTKKDPPAQGGWSAFLTGWAVADILDPVMLGFMNASCDKAMFGWPCDAELEKLRDQFSRESDPAKQKDLAARAQARALEVGTHAPLGIRYQPAAYRKDRIKGILLSPAPLFWNLEKTGS